MDHTPKKLSYLKNIDQNVEKLLNDIGISTPAQFEKLGAEKIYFLLLDAGHKPSLALRNRLKGAEQDIDWRILAEREKRIRRSRTADQDEP